MESSEISGFMQQLYPLAVRMNEHLPTCWSSKDKYQFLGLSQNNLRAGKTHKDAAAVRSNYPIPCACGLYYFEVKILYGHWSFAHFIRLRLVILFVGWDKLSYGYHGDDGHSFCSSGSGMPFGPTFTSNDVIGCGLNMVEHYCFYTKNGQFLGTYTFSALFLELEICFRRGKISICFFGPLDCFSSTVTFIIVHKLLLCTYSG
ncbi:unnamed protein product [Soboliphyme baturini]|uniref:B30.2/SPRY domain-containing protein n=1 Tax=Soboliphyme baturini TaxID=241478 RepID=A0A183IDD4_9BILA|nr:unnamed protein product [Soboliphyme baturini]